MNLLNFKTLIFLTVIFGVLYIFLSDNHKLSKTETATLDLLASLEIGSTYKNLKVTRPNIGPLRADAGDNNTEAVQKLNLLGFDMSGEFNYANGKLVSHGFHVRGLDKEETLKAFTLVKNYLTNHHGKGTTFDPEEDGYDDSYHGPGDDINWKIKNIEFGVYFYPTYDGYQFGWGAQKAQSLTQ